MTHQRQKEVFNTCEGLWGKIRRSLDAYLPETEWDDIRSTAILKVFQNYHRYDSSRPFGPWAYTVMWRMAQNGLRERLPQKKTKTWRWKLNMARPRRIQTVTREVDEVGNEVVVYIPEIEAPTPRVPLYHDEEVMSSFLRTLNKQQRRFITTAFSQARMTTLCKKLRLRHSQGYTMAKNIRIKWENHLTKHTIS